MKKEHSIWECHYTCTRELNILKFESKEKFSIWKTKSYMLNHSITDPIELSIIGILNRETNTPTKFGQMKADLAENN